MALQSVSPITTLFNLCITVISEKLKLAVQNVALESRNSALATQTAALTAQNSALTAQNAALTAQTAALEVQIAQLLVRNDMQKRAIEAQSQNFEALRRANVALLAKLELNSSVICDLRQLSQHAESSHNLLKDLCNQYTWMLADNIHKQVDFLAEILEDQQKNMKKCNTFEEDLLKSQHMVEEALLKQKEPSEAVLESQKNLIQSIEDCYKQRDNYSTLIENCLGAIFEKLARTGKEE